LKLMKSNLPEGWEFLTLGEVAKWSSGGTPQSGIDAYYGGDIPWVVIGDLNEGYVTTSTKTITELGLQKSSAKYVPIDSVMVAMYGASIGRLGIAGIRCTTNQAIAFTEQIFPVTSTKYLFHYLSFMKEELVKLGKGGAQPNISQTILKAIQIPVAPLAEQRRIVAQLEVTLQRLEASQQRLDKLPGLLKQFRQAVLAAAVSGRLTEAWRAENPTQETGADLLARIRSERRVQWEQKQLAKMKGKQLTISDSWKLKYEEPSEPDTNELPELPEGWVYVSVEQLTNGSRPSSYGVLIPGSDIEDGVPMVRVGDINDGKVDITNLKRIDPTIAEEFKRTTLEGGEMLITLVGSIGRTAIAPLELAGANTARAVGVIPLVESVDKHWIEFYFRNPEKVVEMVTKSHEVARKTLNLDDVRRTAVVLPPVTEQLEIVRQVSHYFDLAEALEARFEQAAAMVEQLPKALLTKAFSGQLIPQDPNDEPVSKLLERLRNAPASTKTKRVPKALKPNLQLEFTVPQSLLEILTQHPDGISPEKLFSLAGFTDADVDAFYQELAVLQPHLLEEKPTGGSAKKWPTLNSKIRLKA
jgi:type I restriction enzyme S subunit